MDAINGYAIYSVTNALDRDMVVYYDSKPFSIKSKESKLYPKDLAEHIAIKIAEQIIQKDFVDRYGSQPFLIEVRDTLLKLQSAETMSTPALGVGDLFTKISEELNSKPKTLVEANKVAPLAGSVVETPKIEQPLLTPELPEVDVLASSKSSLPVAQVVEDEAFPDLN